MKNSTIAAIATPVGSGGIGIVKVSGPDALAIAEKIFRKTIPENKSQIEQLKTSFASHKLHHGYIIDPKNNFTVDEVLLAVMKSPNSYTAEDVIEIQAHSGTQVLKLILELVLEHGSKPAGPGEFTKRAFLNGKIDLTQAEAVIDIINARAEKSLQIATNQIMGGLKKKILELKTNFLDILTDIETAIDFSEDVDGLFNDNGLLESFKTNVVFEVENILKSYKDASIIKNGIRISIVGKPNVGKSSLMNRLIKKEKSIVTNIPGTTRDVIEDTLNIKGIPVVISDMAGLHDTKEPVELIGIKKAKESIAVSDLIIFMIDLTTGIEKEDINILREIKDKKTLIAINKTDLFEPGFVLTTPEDFDGFKKTYISALHGSGVNALLNKIVGEVAFEENENMILTNVRQKNLMEKVLIQSKQILNGFVEKKPFELISIDVNEAVGLLDEITGETKNIDILDSIFEKFCIGK